MTTPRQQKLDPFNNSFVNSHQVGGVHYKTPIEHWDFVVACSLNYLEGNATKYLTRSHKKSGLQDLQKSLHYVSKLIAVVSWSESRSWWLGWVDPKPELRPARQRNSLPRHWVEFCEVNDIEPELSQFIGGLCNWSDLGDLRELEEALTRYVNHRFDLKG